jgi:uncharacterized protein (TIGR03067 family)
MKHYLAGFVSLVAILPITSIGGAQNDQGKSIQGTWKIVSLEAWGEKVPEGELAKLTVKVTADRFIFSEKGREDDSKKYRLNPKKKPMEIELITESFAKGATKATEHVTPGIIDLKVDVLRVCYGVFQPGKKDVDGKLTQAQIDAKRPTEFKAGKNVHLIVLKRQK